MLHVVCMSCACVSNRCVRLLVCLRACACACMRARVCMHACADACVCVCAHECVRVCACTRVHMHACMCACMRVRVCTLQCAGRGVRQHRCDALPRRCRLCRVGHHTRELPAPYDIHAQVHTPARLHARTCSALPKHAGLQEWRSVDSVCTSARVASAHPSARVSRQGRVTHARLMHGGYGDVHDVDGLYNKMQHMMQHSRVRDAATQYNTMQHSRARDVATQYNKMQHSRVRDAATQYNTMPHSRARDVATQYNTMQRSRARDVATQYNKMQHSRVRDVATQYNRSTCSTVQRHQHTLPCRSDTAKSGGPADSRQKLQMLLLAQPGMQAREAVPVRHSVSARFVPARRFTRYDTAISPAMHSTALALQGSRAMVICNHVPRRDALAVLRGTRSSCYYKCAGGRK